MKRIHAKYEYHDSTLIEVAWLRDCELRMTFELDGHWNNGSSFVVSILFSNVRNRMVVESSLHEIALNRTHEHWLADVVGIWKEASGNYVIDTSQGSIMIEASSFTE